MSKRPIFVVTQVAPYSGGPAGVHGVLGQASTAFCELGAMRGLEPVPVAHVQDIAPSRIEEGGVLALFNIGNTPWSAEQRTAVTSALKSGHLSVLAVHSATDASNDWDDYASVVGARFDGHPWTCDFSVEVVDRSNPSTSHLGERFAWHDEVYLFHQLRDDARVLLRVADDQLDMSVPGARVPECGLPLAWCFEEGKGRCFYTALGHFPHAWETPDYLQHIAGGLSWVLENSD